MIELTLIGIVHNARKMVEDELPIEISLSM